jgi:putative phage-type endonuclease
MSALPVKFHQDRATGIGGSDAAAVLGLSAWKTPLDVYLEKVGLAQPSEDTAATKWGRLLEPAVRQEYSERTGFTVTQPRELRRSEKYPFMIAHPDGLVIDPRRGYEGKTARTDHGWGEPGTDEVPQDYLIQVQHYMVVEVIPVWDVAVLIGGQDYRQYEIPADRELQELIIEAEHDLWQRVQRGEPPDPTWQHANTMAAIRKLYPGTNGKTVDASEKQVQLRAVMEEAAERASIAERVADGTKAMLLWDMKDNAVLRFPDGRVLRRKEVQRKGYTVEATSYMDARFAKE